MIRSFGETHHLRPQSRNQPRKKTGGQAGVTRWFLAQLIFHSQDGDKLPSETSVHIPTTRRYTPEYGNTQRIKFYKVNNLYINTFYLATYKFDIVDKTATLKG
jgi:hypothetical protein